MVVISQMFQPIKNIQSYENKYDFGGLEFYSRKICLHEGPQYLFARVQESGAPNIWEFISMWIANTFYTSSKLLDVEARDPVWHGFFIQDKAMKGYLMTPDAHV